MQTIATKNTRKKFLISDYDCFVHVVNFVVYRCIANLKKKWIGMTPASSQQDAGSPKLFCRLSDCQNTIAAHIPQRSYGS
jgi:hypothetical protein